MAAAGLTLRFLGRRGTRDEVDQVLSRAFTDKNFAQELLMDVSPEALEAWARRMNKSLGRTSQRASQANQGGNTE